MTNPGAAAAGVSADRWDRPLIVPLDGGEPVAYTRVSTLAKALDDLNNLMAWKQRLTAHGLLARPDLLTKLSGAIAATASTEADAATKRTVNAICEEATQAVGATTGRTAGTGFHWITEAVDGGAEPLHMTTDDRMRLYAYRNATRNIEWLDVECFVVNDAVRAAGTFDRLGRLPDGRVVVADLKSGKSEAAYPFSTTVQIAIYANAVRYDGNAGGARSPLHPDLDPTTGLLIHMPPSGGCALYELDLTRGWQAAQLATQVRECRAWKAGDLARPVFYDDAATSAEVAW